MGFFFLSLPDYPINSVASFLNHQRAACNSGTRAINLRQNEEVGEKKEKKLWAYTSAQVNAILHEILQAGKGFSAR